MDSQKELLQLKLFKALSIILAILLLAGAGYYYYRTRQVQPVAIMVNGQQVAVASNMSVATRAMAALKHNQLGSAFEGKGKPVYIERIQLQRIPDSQATEIDTDDTIQTKLSSKVHLTVIAGAIVVDKVTVVGLPTVDMANEALDAVKQHYVSMPPPDTVTDEATFREHVSVVKRRIPARMARQTVAEAVEALTALPPAKTYVVKNHDTGWLIARRFHMNFTKFIHSNAGIDINKLKIGDVVNVSVTVPPVTVVVTKRSDREESIRKGVSTERAGKRRISVETTYVNGHPEGDPRTLNVTTLQRATPSSSVL